MRLRSGWFSERDACYLASGKPVIAQSTGFENYLPTGEGLFAFRTMDDVLAADRHHRVRLRAGLPRRARGGRGVARGDARVPALPGGHRAVSGRYVIFNADDFGYSRGINRGIVEAHDARRRDRRPP